MSPAPLSRRSLLRGLAGAAAIAPLRASAHSQPGDWQRSVGVVVVGLGAAGACAALGARELGARTLVLEGAAAGGGSTRLAGGEIYLGGGTPVQQALGFEDSSEEMFKYLLASSGPGADEEKIRLYCERSLDHYAWLVAQGIEFKASFWPEHHDAPTDDGLRWGASEAAHPFDEIARPAPRSHKVRQAGMAGAALMDRLIARVSAAGAEIVTNARCERLVVDEGGGVVGVEAATPAGVQRIRATGGVVLATGGFTFNREMLALYAPMLVDCSPIGATTDDGSGIRMGIGLGAAAIHMDAGFVGLALHPPEEILQGILVDRRGQRFVNEDCYLGRVGEHARLRADGDVHLVLDASITSAPLLGDDELVATAGSAAELGTKLAMPALAGTLAFYDEHAAVGRDPLFGKKPQFLRPLAQPPLRAYRYAVGRSFYPAFTLGGLWTRPGGEVRRPDGSSVAGLYAAGRVASGVPARGYNSGTSIGDGTFFGRLAGRSAAGAARA